MTGVAFAVLAKSAPTPSARPSTTLIVFTGVLAAAIVLLIWSLVRHSITAAHEGGHALFAALFGGTVKSVHLNHPKQGNVTTFSGVGGLGRFVTAMMGYLSPSAFGLVGALLLGHGSATAVLWISLVFLAILLLQVAHLRGVLIVLATGGVIFLVARYAAPDVRTMFAFTWIWFLLFGGFRGAIGLIEARRDTRAKKKKDESSDAFQLRKLTYIPTTLWVGFFSLTTLSALILGAAILLGMLGRPTG
ncbi:MAG TPA: M50 family metallopeptidase [Rugosimonospora sp.]|nr:M50 family metallopeptidase [Rugosimonospora sp.]